MSRTLTAQIQAMSPYRRLAFYVALQKAASNTRVASQKANLHLAARHVYAFLDGPDMDIMLRLQVLEGVVTGKVGQGKWWRQGRRGLSQAKDALAGKPVDPSWFSTGNTGMISKVIAMMRAAYKRWSSRYTIIKEVDDLVANLVMGLGASGKPMPQGPVALQVGAKNSGVRKSVLDGSESPTDTVGPITKFALKKIGDEARWYDKSKTTDQLEEGGSVYDYTQSSGADFGEVLEDLVSDPRSPIQGLLQKTFEKELGVGKWADIAADFFGRTLRREKIRKGEMAAEYGIAAGTFSKVLKTKVYPAIESLKSNRHFQEQVSDIVEHERRGRYASMDNPGRHGHATLDMGRSTLYFRTSVSPHGMTPSKLPRQAALHRSQIEKFLKVTFGAAGASWSFEKSEPHLDIEDRFGSNSIVFVEAIKLKVDKRRVKTLMRLLDEQASRYGYRIEVW